MCSDGNIKVALCPRVCKAIRKYVKATYPRLSLTVCSQCGHLNPENTQFCGQCGSTLITPLTESASTQPVEQPVSPTKRLTGLQKAVIIGVALVAVLVIGVVASMSYNPTGVSPTPYQQSWHSIGSYSGGSDSVVDTVTSPFHVNGTQFRINWQYTTQFPQYSVFGFYVYKSGSTVDLWCQSGDSTDFPSCDYSTSTAADGVRTDSGPGDFQVRVLHANANWTITIQDYW